MPPLKRLSFRLLAYNLTILTGGEIVTRILTFLAFVFLARLFGPQLFGLVEITLAVMMILNLTIEQGFGVVGTREIARRPERTETLVSQIVSIQFAVSCASYVILLLVTFFLPIDPTLHYLLLGFGLSILGIPLILRWVFQGRNQMLWVALPQVLRYAIFFSIVLLIITSNKRIILLPLAEIIAVYVTAIMCILVFNRSIDSPRLPLFKVWDRGLITESLPVAGSQLIWVLRMYMPIIIVGILASKSDVGLFGAAHRIFMVFQAMIWVYFLNLFPAMSQSSHVSKDHLASLLHGSLRMISLPSIAFAGVLSLFSSKVILFVFGIQFVQKETIITLTILAWVFLILIWRNHARNGLIAMGRQREEFICSLVGLALLVILLIPLTFRLGPSGSAYSMLSSEVVATALIWYRIKNYVPQLKPLKHFLSIPQFSHVARNIEHAVTTASPCRRETPK